MKTFLKRVLPASLRTLLSSVLARAQLKMAEVASWTRPGTALYYLLFSPAFFREHRAVLKGKIHYWRSLSDVLETSYLLRRNTHRLEKGLVMRPRRGVFAEDYIGETVACFERASVSKAICRSELSWAADVLDTYFSAVQPTPMIEAARNRFQLSKQHASSVPTRVPFPHGELPSLQLGFDALEALFIRRRSVRWFDSVPVPVEKLEKAVRAAITAPSACNRQAFGFYVAQNDKAQMLAALAGGTAGFNHNISCTVAVVGNLDAYPYERDRHLIYIDASLASMQFMLALESLGLSTCPINWPDLPRPEAAIQKLLGLEPYERAIMLIAVGYADPDGGVAYSQKKSIANVMKMV